MNITVWHYHICTSFYCICACLHRIKPGIQLGEMNEYVMNVSIKYL